ncbi:hypothetical protein CesoFtcFv8_014370 [Champsocephalus esox]|uniref:UPAR/Ly6 domain-containing protein n=1 Tax=Champsocephalus esox TaxID=159716 RepID=A0AAN8BTD9_9TELE|nr:hypothetical protein CesoFtcFv8_014370 [Champsocephalus esox]
MRLLGVFTLLLLSLSSGLALQIQCYQCEETTLDCSTPPFFANCTVNVQDMCQKEVLVKADGKACSSCLPSYVCFHLYFPVRICQNRIQ